MGLSSDQLEAFREVARAHSFSRAAERLRLTQPALSQRIQKLEQSLGRSLLLRQPGGIQLTEYGERLLRYCQTKEALEEEFLHEVRRESEGQIGGVIRLAAYSSVMRSALLPALAPLLREQNGLQLEIVSDSALRIPKLLKRAEVDFAVLDYSLSSVGVREDVLGQEVYVAIESTKFPSPKDLYLDLHSDDPATEKFFRHQDKDFPKYRRSYLGEVYAILDAVELGLGRAVMPRHLIKKRRPIKIIRSYRALTLPVVLHYHEQAYYSSLHRAVVDTLKKSVGGFLG